MRIKQNTKNNYGVGKFVNYSILIFLNEPHFSQMKIQVVLTGIGSEAFL